MKPRRRRAGLAEACAALSGMSDLASWRHPIVHPSGLGEAALAPPVALLPLAIALRRGRP